MDRSALIPASQASMWESLAAWVGKVSAFFGVVATTTVHNLKQAYLAADRIQRADMRVVLRDAEYLLRHLLVAAALALRLDPPRQPPARETHGPFDVMPASPARRDARDNGNAAPMDMAPTDTALCDHEGWLARHSGPMPLAWNVNDEAEDFAHRYLAFSRIVANPEAVILALARRFIRDSRQAIADVTYWVSDMHGALSSSIWREVDTIGAVVREELEGFRLFVEPG